MTPQDEQALRSFGNSGWSGCQADFTKILQATSPDLLNEVGLSAQVRLNSKPGSLAGVLADQVHLRRYQKSYIYSTILPEFQLSLEDEFEIYAFRMAASCFSLLQRGQNEAQILAEFCCTLAFYLSKNEYQNHKRIVPRVSLQHLQQRAPLETVHIALRICLPYLVRIREYRWVAHNHQNSPEGADWWTCFHGLSRLLNLSYLQIKERCQPDYAILGFEKEWKYAQHRVSDYLVTQPL